MQSATYLDYLHCHRSYISMWHVQLFFTRGSFVHSSNHQGAVHSALIYDSVLQIKNPGCACNGVLLQQYKLHVLAFVKSREEKRLTLLKMYHMNMIHFVSYKYDTFLYHNGNKNNIFGPLSCSSLTWGGPPTRWQYTVLFSQCPRWHLHIANTIRLRKRGPMYKILSYAPANSYQKGGRFILCQLTNWRQSKER